jgi:hypothetical protein
VLTIANMTRALEQQRVSGELFDLSPARFTLKEFNANFSKNASLTKTELLQRQLVSLKSGDTTLTARMARKITERYPTMTALYKAIKEGGENVLRQIQYADGQFLDASRAMLVKQALGLS